MWQKKILDIIVICGPPNPDPLQLHKQIYSTPVALKFHGGRKQLRKKVSAKAPQWVNNLKKIFKGGGKQFRTNLYLYRLVYKSIKHSLSFNLHKSKWTGYK